MLVGKKHRDNFKLVGKQNRDNFKVPEATDGIRSTENFTVPEITGWRLSVEWEFRGRGGRAKLVLFDVDSV